jgi:hypothetical protein
VRISTYFLKTNISYLGRRLGDWKRKLFILKTTTDIRHFVFVAHAECAVKNWLCMHYKFVGAYSQHVLILTFKF